MTSLDLLAADYLLVITGFVDLIRTYAACYDLCGTGEFSWELWFAIITVNVYMNLCYVPYKKGASLFLP